MSRFQHILSYLLFALHILLLFLLLFQEKVNIPIGFQTIGRMHPMVLHLPIGLLLITGLFWFCKQEFEGENFAKLFRFVLAITAITANIAALMGFFLSKEEGYTASLLTWHKYGGIVLSFLCYGLWMIYQPTVKTRVFTSVLCLSLVVLLVTGHYGASLTHGEDYLFPNNKEETELVFIEDTPIFEAVIQPILKEKCYQCHNEQKTKGGLLMTTLAGLKQGGKNGPIWMSGNALQSHLIERANLPLEDKKHMPPKGKTQLTPEEIAVLSAWINDGTDTKKTLKQLAVNSPIKAYWEKNKKSQSSTTEVAYDFDPANEQTLQKLNTPFRVIFPLANGSPALQADFFVRQAFKKEQLSELADIKEQLVVLNVSNMPITNEDLKTIGQFEHLEKLVLNNTDITGENLSSLQGLTNLKSLSLSGTKQSKSSLAQLAKLPALKQVYVWNTSLTELEVNEIQKQVPAIHFEKGYIPTDTEMLKLTPPILENEDFVLSKPTLISFKHPLKGVTIRYTVNGQQPDSLNSPVYQKPIELNTYTILKAKAVKAHWYASDMVEYVFFKGKYHPKSVELINQPNPQYMGEGGSTLINLKKGDANDFKNKAWLSYREKPFEALFTFDKPTPIQSVMLSLGRNLGGFIFPPTSIEIWAGNSKSSLQLIQKINPTQPLKDGPVRIEPIEVTLKAGNYSFIKVIARPVTKLPSWHNGKGQPGWVFIDEVFFY
ncbi:chitobiase/beta-hexosaminidase C-terminal domain-containing protein [Flectobacillus roseus]|uniref:chitobiase/beta-hexosaminidase C-terminal domain-containing protein n=1 Tax=Flectobacillus roseus TaxID=502259 RepID=UPI0024B771EA|nr:chitobiase/beta-hexosaminidase C-terminal domain-containing protein [Flectobacillus roseus]MDI9869642.1 FN3 associated domain-containing protein [Flectobacillus roseus]